MEKIGASKLLLHINLCSLVLPFYGKRIECAKLYSKLSKDTREFWNDNLFIILDSVLKGAIFSKGISFKGNFNQQHYDFLVKNKYLMLYYRINIILETEAEYALCLKLMQHVENIGEELNEEFKSDMREEYKETVKGK